MNFSPSSPLSNKSLPMENKIQLGLGICLVCFATLFVSLFTVSGIAQDDSVSGNWQMSVELTIGSGEPTFVFEQEGELISGTYQGTFGSAEVVGRIDGDQIDFSFEVQGTTATYTGTINGATMEGSCDYGDLGEGTWSGHKIDNGA